MSFPASEAARVEAAYKNATCILEYGSGGSTVLAAQTPGRMIYSVESDFDFGMDVQHYLDVSSPASLPMIYYVDIGPTGAWGRPVNNDHWAKFHHYPMRIWDENFFRQPEVILIDGRFRPACFAAACLRTQAPVTILFDDYVNRPNYSIVEQLAKPVDIVGRMAVFELVPKVYEGKDLAMLLELNTWVTYANKSSKSVYGQLPKAQIPQV